MAEPVNSQSRTDPDAEAVRRVISGEKEAFETLVARYEVKIFNVCYRMLGSQEEARELTQDIFLKAFRKIKGFRGDSKFSTWLFQVAVNHCRNRLKYLKRRRYYDTDSTDEPIHGAQGEIERQLPDNARRPDVLSERAVMKRILHEAIQALSEDFRTAIILRDIQGLSYEEIAEVTGIPEGTVKSRIHRARMEHKERLKHIL